MSKLKEKVLEFRITKLRDEGAYAEFFRERFPHIHRFALVRVRAPEIAEDIAGEAFLQVWRYIFVEHQPVDHLTALLLTITRRLIIDHYRQHEGKHENIEEHLATLSDTGSFISRLEVKAESATVRDALSRLHREYREVIVLRFLDEFEISEIAVVLQKSAGAVRVLIHRALVALRAELKR